MNNGKSIETLRQRVMMAEEEHSCQGQEKKDPHLTPKQTSVTID
jgi:hypothetical protein